MSNSGNKGVFSNNIGSSVGGFTKRNSTDAGSGTASGSTTERRRVSTLESICPHFIVLPLARSAPRGSRSSVSTSATYAILLCCRSALLSSTIPLFRDDDADMSTNHSPPRPNSRASTARSVARRTRQLQHARQVSRSKTSLLGSSAVCGRTGLRALGSNRTGEMGP